MSDEKRALVAADINDVFGLGKALNSPAVTRLVEAISNGIGVVYQDVLGPWATKRHASAAAEAVRELSSMEGAGRNAELDLSGRAVFRLKKRDLKRQENRENISYQALSEIKKSDSECGELPIESIWLSKFWAEAELVSELDLQSLWGAVLARKAEDPSRFGIRVVQRLASLSRSELDQLVQIAPFITRILSGDKDLFPDQYGILKSIGQYQGTFTIAQDIQEKFQKVTKGIFPKYDSVALDSAGVALSSTGWAAEFAVPYSPEIVFEIGNKKFLGRGFPPPSKRFENFYTIASGSGFSREGWEIIRLSNQKPNEIYLNGFLEVIRSAGIEIDLIE